MANNPQESSPLLPQQTDSNPNPNKSIHNNNPNSQKLDNQNSFSLPKQPPIPMVAEGYGLVGHGFPVGQPILGRGPWSSGICSCLGLNDYFCSSDLEVCLLGSVAPCVLYGSNVERLGSPTESFSHHCLSYAALYLIGNTFFGWNCLAPWFSYTSRTAVRRMYNLEGSCEALTRHCGCCGSIVEDEMQREQCETACDFATHVFCHPCALCQEAREIRRRVPHPGFHNQSVVFMVPPGEQAMGRE